MAREKTLHKYPKEYESIFRLAQKGTYSLVFPSPEAAKNMRDNLYNYRRVLRKQVRVSKSLLEQVNAVSITFKDSTLTFFIRGKDNDSSK